MALYPERIESVSGPARGIPAMSSNVRGNEAAELNELLDAMPAATTCATELLRQSTIHDPAYVAAEAQISKMLTRISELMNKRHGTP